MRPLLGVLAVVLLSAGALSCGRSSVATPTRNTSSAAAVPSDTSSTHKNDRDNDNDNNDDDQHVLAFGHLADATDGRAITTVLTRYYAAAAAEDGATGCSLLTPFIAETVVETDGHAPGSRGTTCAEVLSKLFAHRHQELIEKKANLKIVRIGVEGNKSLVALEFPEVPVVRQITMRRDQGKWTVLYLFDGIIE